MTKYREILRLTSLGLSQQSISDSCGVSKKTVNRVLKKDAEGHDLPKTVINREFSSEWKPGDEPYFPVNDEKNSHLYQAYKALADKQDKVLFGGRLGEYKYYDMDQVIEKAQGDAISMK